jgi:hypothetical protein
MKGKTDLEAAEEETRQEAGVIGRISKAPIGHYSYWKRLTDVFVPITVSVFALEVVEELAKF